MWDNDIDEEFLLEALEEVENCVNPTFNKETLQRTPPDSMVLNSFQNNETNSSQMKVWSNENSEESYLTKRSVLPSPLKTGNNNNSGKINLYNNAALATKSSNQNNFYIKTKDLASNVLCNNSQLKTQLNVMESKQPLRNVQNEHLKHSMNSSIEKASLSRCKALITPVFNSPKPNIRKRKFPGPAGILPSMNLASGLSNSIKSLTPTINKSNQPLNNEEEVYCSQASSTNDFNVDIYQKMHDDVPNIDEKSPLNFFNIQWLHQQRKRNFRSQKIPVLAVTIKSIDHTHLYVDAVFRDLTGSIRGRGQEPVISGDLDKLVVEKYCSMLVPGSGLLLKNLGVLARLGTRKSFPNHYLNITLNSLVNIYSLDDDHKICKTIVNSLSYLELKELVEVAETKSSVDIFSEQDEEVTPPIVEQPTLEPQYSSPRSTVIHRPPIQKASVLPKFSSPRPKTFLVPVHKKNDKETEPIIPDKPTDVSNSNLNNLKSNHHDKSSTNSIFDDDMDDLLASIDTDIYY